METEILKTKPMYVRNQITHQIKKTHLKNHHPQIQLRRGKRMRDGKQGLETTTSDT